MGCLDGFIPVPRPRLLPNGVNSLSYAAIELDGQSFIPIQDLRRSIVRLLDMEGRVVDSPCYSAVGVPWDCSDLKNPWGFCGKRFDVKSGLFYFGLRHYFSEGGRWLSRDPAGFRQSLNLYQYCLNDPWGHIDPNGDLFFVVTIGGITLGKILWASVGVAAMAVLVDALRDSSGSKRTGYTSSGGKKLFNGVMIDFTSPTGGYNESRSLQFLPVGGAFLVERPILTGVSIDGGSVGQWIGASGTLQLSESESKEDGFKVAGPHGDVSEPFQGGRRPRASEIQDWAEGQGWKLEESPTGPKTYVDENGTVRVKIKRGSARVPGSETPHVEIRNAENRRVDPNGNPVTRRSPNNHTPIDWDL